MALDTPELHDQYPSSTMCATIFHKSAILLFVIFPPVVCPMGFLWEFFTVYMLETL
jgi:hypothetical protein